MPDQTAERLARDPESLKLGVFTFVCDSIGESAFAEVAPDAVRGMILSCRDHELRFLFIDDASQCHIGVTLVNLCRSLGVDAHVIRLEKALGYRDGCERTIMSLNWIQENWADIDLVVKTDCDALIIRNDFGKVLNELSSSEDNPACWGYGLHMRRRDRILYLADLLPIGFRRAVRSEKITRDWELRRLKPVWWWRWGIKGLFRGFSFRYVGGSFYIMNRAAIRILEEHGCLTSHTRERLGFVTSEEDVLITTFLRACGARIVDLSGVSPPLFNLRVSSSSDVSAAIETGSYVVHPIKRLGQSLDLVRNLHSTWLRDV